VIDEFAAMRFAPTISVTKTKSNRLSIANRPGASIVTLGKLTYAGNLENLAPVAEFSR
jgi:dTDP-D-glucose 4,6-dehydratase